VRTRSIEGQTALAPTLCFGYVSRERRSVKTRVIRLRVAEVIRLSSLIPFILKVRKNGQQKTWRLSCNIAAKRVVLRCCAFYHQHKTCLATNQVVNRFERRWNAQHRNSTRFAVMLQKRLHVFCCPFFRTFSGNPLELARVVLGPVHTNPGGKICGFKTNVWIRVNGAWISATCANKVMLHGTIFSATQRYTVRTMLQLFETMSHWQHVATLCCAKNRRCDSSFVTSPLICAFLLDKRNILCSVKRVCLLLWFISIFS